MDFMQDSEEDSKYAFLLGSALRNDDTEQLFVVYDNLIPSIISDSRLERIKEGARYISELPECDFNSLVLNARTFSLASGRSSTNMDSHSNRLSGLCHDGDEECEAVSIMQGEKATTTHYGSLNLQASLKPTPSKAVDDSLKLDLLGGDQDSGFRGSSSFKANSFKNSISCSESNDDSEEERPGCFNYVQLTQKNRADEHVRIRPTLNPDYDEDIKVDSSTGGSSVESPRSETSVTHEEYNLADDVEMQVFNHSSQDYRRTDGGQPASVAAVNEHQHLYGMPKQRGHEFYEFDSSSHLKPKRAESYSYNCCQDSSAASQKKSRVSVGARGYSKDDSTKVTSPVGLDVNGNPPAQDLDNYMQMRQPVNAGKVAEGGSSSLSTLSNHHSLTATQAPVHLGEPGSEFEKKRRLRKLKKQSKQKSQLSEAVDDFKGNQPIEDLLSFIEGGDNINNHKKASPQNNSGSAGKTEKQKKKQDKTKEDLNGSEDKSTANATKTVKSPSVINSSSSVMGNSTAKDCVEDNLQIITASTATTTTTTPTNNNTNSVSATVSSKNKKNITTTSDDHDHNSGEFFDCLNSLPDDNKGHSKSSPNNKQDVSASNQEITKQELTVTSKNFKNDAKNSGTKGSVKKQKSDPVEDIHDINESKQFSSLPKQRANSFENSDLPTNSLKVSNKIEDIAAQESTQAFIEVKKKKKRNVINSVGSVQQQNHSYYPKESTFSNNNKPWRPQRPAQLGGSNSTAHGGSVNSNVIESNNKTSNLMLQSSEDRASFDEKFTRDLSPSAFPVLMCHTNASSNIGARPERRNSCGDINDVKAEVVSETRSYCDSDRESVKSLPAAHNVRAAGESSPLYPVSYATMLVTAQRERRCHNNGDSSNSPSSESGIVCDSQTSSINSYFPHSSLEMVSPPPPPPAQVDSDGNCTGGASTPDRKTTVWKGSPRERRHSIGSSPDDSKPETDKSAVNSRHRQKSGSQECLAVNVASSPQSNLPGMKEATTKELDSVDTSSNQVPVLHFPEHVESLDSNTANSCGELRTKSSKISPTVALSSSSSTRPIQSSVFPSNVHQQTSSSSERAGGNNPSKLISVSKKTTTDKQVGSSGVVMATKKGSANNTKSVIFLDERFGNNKAADLGITFGFDSSMESKIDFQSLSSKQTGHLENPSNPSLASSNVITSLPSSSLSALQQQISTPVPSQLSTNSSNIPTTATKSSNASSQHQSSDIVPQPLLSGSSSEKAQIKGLLTSNPSNGLVLPPSSVMKGSAATTTTTTATSGAMPKLSANISSATTTTSNSQSISNDNSVTKSEDTINSFSKNNNSSRPPTTPNSSSANLLPQQLTMPPSAKVDGQKVAHPVPHPTNNQQQSSHVVLPHPNANNSPIVIPHAFIGQTVLFSRHFPPPPIHPQVVAMPPPPLPPATVMDKLSSVITTVQPSTNPITTNQTLSGVPVVTTSSITTSITTSSGSTPPPPQSSSPSSNESATVTSPILSLPSDAKTESTATLPLDTPIKVVYGLRIKPDVGCGTVFFRPIQHFSKKPKRNNIAELTGLLKRKWMEVQDLECKGAEKYITVSDQ